MAAAATSGPQAPRRFAPGAPPPRTSARPPAKAAAVEAAAVMVEAPPPRPQEPPTRTSPNRGRGGFVTQAGQGRRGACLRRGAPPGPTFRPEPPPLGLPAEAAAPALPSRLRILLGLMRRPPLGPIQAGLHRACQLPRPLPGAEGPQPQPWTSGRRFSPNLRRREKSQKSAMWRQLRRSLFCDRN